LVQSPGSTSTAPLRIRVENAGPAGVEVEVAAIVSANVAGPPPNTVLSGQVPSSVSLTPTQVGSLLSLDVAATAKPESSGDASAHGDRVADAGPANNSRALIGVVATPGAHASLQSSRPGNSALLGEAKPDDFPGPNGDDLMAVVLPFDRATLERAVDHFFQQLDELEVRDLVGTDLTRIVFLSFGLATSVAALEVARRRLRQWTTGGKGLRVGDTLVSGDDLGFPDLPGSWSSRLT